MKLKDKLRRQKNGEKQEREAEIDLIIEQDEVLYPVEIKLSANPKLSMANAFDLIEKIPGKKRRTGAVVCMYEAPLWLNEKTVVLPAEYL